MGHERPKEHGSIQGGANSLRRPRRGGSSTRRGSTDARTRGLINQTDGRFRECPWELLEEF